MKTLIIIIVLLFCFLGCTKQRLKLEDYSEIKVGMTYDEVEKTLASKPAEIGKGVSSTTYTDDTPEYSMLGDDIRGLTLKRDFLQQIQPDSMHWQSVSVQTTGQLIYTNWIMPDAPTKVDTIKDSSPCCIPTKTRNDLCLQDNILP